MSAEIQEQHGSSSFIVHYLQVMHNKIKHRNIVVYGGFKKSISEYTTASVV
jgi:hypothetical protein